MTNPKTPVIVTYQDDCSNTDCTRVTPIQATLRFQSTAQHSRDAIWVRCGECGTLTYADQLNSRPAPVDDATADVLDSGGETDG